MNKQEYKLQLKAIAKLLWVCGFALLYAFGGIEHKWLRRLAAPAVLTSGMFVFSRDWRVFLQMPLLMVSLSLGYGAEAFCVKISRRIIYGLANGSTAIAHIFNRNFHKRDFWILFNLNLILCVIICVGLGVFNPMGSARAEELAIGFIIGFLSMFIPKDKE